MGFLCKFLRAELRVFNEIKNRFRSQTSTTSSEIESHKEILLFVEQLKPVTSTFSQLTPSTARRSQQVWGNHQIIHFYDSRLTLIFFTIKWINSNDQRWVKEWAELSLSTKHTHTHNTVVVRSYQFAALSNAKFPSINSRIIQTSHHISVRVSS